MGAMTDSYRQLLDATIEHLEQLKAHGVRFVPLAAESMTALNQNPRPAFVNKTATPQPAPRSVPVAKPAPAVAPAVSKPIVAAKPAEVDLALGMPGGTPAVAAAALSAEAKNAAFADLRTRALACV